MDEPAQLFLYETCGGARQLLVASRRNHRLCVINPDTGAQIGLAYRKHVYHRRGIIDTTFIRPPGMQIGDYTRAELTAAIERVGFTLDRTGVQPLAVGRRIMGG